MRAGAEVAAGVVGVVGVKVKASISQRRKPIRLNAIIPWTGYLGSTQLSSNSIKKMCNGGRRYIFDHKLTKIMSSKTATMAFGARSAFDENKHIITILVLDG